MRSAITPRVVLGELIVDGPPLWSSSSGSSIVLGRREVGALPALMG